MQEQCRSCLNGALPRARANVNTRLMVCSAPRRARSQSAHGAWSASLRIRHRGPGALSKQRDRVCHGQSAAPISAGGVLLLD